MANAVTLGLLVILTATGGLSLRCWQCMSDVVAGCGEPFEAQELPGPVDCSDPPPPALRNAPLRPVCIKEELQLNEVEVVVTRACGWARLAAGGAFDYCSEEQRSLPTHVRVLSCASCFSDGCNAACAHAPHALLLIGALLHTLALSGAH